MNMPMRHARPVDLAPLWMPFMADWRCPLATANRLDASDDPFGSGKARDGSAIRKDRASAHPGP